jgi:hypothetical protein
MTENLALTVISSRLLPGNRKKKSNFLVDHRSLNYCVMQLFNGRHDGSEENLSLTGIDFSKEDSQILSNMV